MMIHEVPAGAGWQELRNTIDACYADGGGIVFIPDMTITVSQQVSVPSDVTIQGNGSFSRIVSTSSTAPVFRVAAGARNVGFKNLSIEGANQASTSPNQNVGIYFENGVENIWVESCTVIRTGGSAILFDNISDTAITRNVTIRDCYLAENLLPSTNWNLFCDISLYGRRFEDIRITGNTCLSGNDTGISIVTDSLTLTNKILRNVYIANNRCENHRRHGIILAYGALPSEGIFAINNICRNNGWMGIYHAPNPAADSDKLIISGNVCSLNGFSTEGSSSIRGGIVLSGSRNATISNNVCEDNRGSQAAGIRFEGEEIIITGNICRNNDYDGLHAWAGEIGADKVTIVSNRAIDNSGVGVNLEGKNIKKVSRSVVSNNVCLGNGSYGINLWYCFGIQISDNRIESNGNYGVYIRSNSNKIVLQNNTFKDNTNGARLIEPPSNDDIVLNNTDL